MSRWFRFYDDALIDRRNGGANGMHYAPHGWDSYNSRGVGMRPPAHEWSALRTSVFKRDGYSCSYCGAHGVRLECDHIIPVSRGGGHDIGNLATACFKCNREKHNRTPSEMGWRMQ